MTAGLQNTVRQDPSVLRMAAPLVVSFVMRAAFTMVDTIFAATIGDAAIAAIGLTIPFEFVLIAIWIGLSTGLTSNLSRAVGTGMNRRIEQYMKSALRLVQFIAPGFALTGIVIWFVAPHMSLAEDVTRQFRIYGTTMLCGASLTSFWSILPDSMIKAHQDTRTTMWAGIISNVLNILMNALFLFVFGWGIFGIAFSTVLGRLGGLAYATVKANAHETRRKAEQVEVDCTPDPRPYRTLFTLMIPAALTFTLMASETGLVNLLLSRMHNATEAIVAYSIFYRVALFALNPIIAIGVALLPYTARRFGRGDIAGIRKGLRDAGLAMVGYTMLFVAPIMAVITPWVARSLTESDVSAEFTPGDPVPGSTELPPWLTVSVVPPGFRGDAAGQPRSDHRPGAVSRADSADGVARHRPRSPGRDPSDLRPGGGTAGRFPAQFRHVHCLARKSAQARGDNLTVLRFLEDREVIPVGGSEGGVFFPVQLEFVGNLHQHPTLQRRDGAVRRRDRKQTVQKGDALFPRCHLPELPGNQVVLAAAEQETLLPGHLHNQGGLVPGQGTFLTDQAAHHVGLHVVHDPVGVGHTTQNVGEGGNVPGLFRIHFLQGGCDLPDRGRFPRRRPFISAGAPAQS